MGYGSRKEVKILVKSGLVKVNNELARDSSLLVDTNKDRVTLDDKEIVYRDKVYMMMNKPASYISAREDNKGQKTVIDLLADEYKHMNISPAGRLDIDTEGLLLLTNDGAFIHNIISPKKNVVKKYFALLEREVKDDDIRAFEKGIELADGYRCLPARLEVLDNNSAYVYISEGKYHQVKRMFYARRNKVLYLKRVQIGGLELDPNLKLGEYRDLSEEEKAKMLQT